MSAAELNSLIPAELRPYVVEEARMTGKALGVGSYGSVEVAEIRGARCVAKKLHEALLPPPSEADGADRMTETFVAECHLMSTLRHPHIVQFLGVCFMSGSRVPVLLMEKLMTDLHSFLETNKDIPQAIKRSVLIDVAKGFTYLHSHNPPVIHRDLTARNVLLNSSLSAKITDLGNSRIVDPRHGRLATMTKNSGNMYYMPPEAQQDHSYYNTAIDIFAFGHLTLFTLTQTFPNVKPATYLTEGMFPRLVGRSEVDRRSDSMDRITQEFGKQHPLVHLVETCLRNNYRKRPAIKTLLQHLESISLEPHKSWGKNKLEMMMDIERQEREIETVKEQTQAQQHLIKDMQKRIQSLQAENKEQREVNKLQQAQLHVKFQQVESAQKEKVKLHNETNTLSFIKQEQQHQIELLYGEIIALQQVSAAKDAVMRKHQAEMTALRKDFDKRSHAQRNSKQAQVDALEMQLRALNEEVETLNRELEDKQSRHQDELERQQQLFSILETQFKSLISKEVQNAHFPIEKLPRTSSVNVFERKIMTEHRSITVDQLQIQEQLGTGQFGIVHKALYIEGGNRTIVAVKSLKGPHVHDRSLIHKMMAESLKLRDFNHPNVLGLIGVCLDTGVAPYIIMPYMANGSLQQYLKRNRQNLLFEGNADKDEVEEAKKSLTVMCLQIAQGMEYLSEQKFVHRDLASRNCMVDEHFVIKIADFGMSEDVYAQNYFRQGKDSSVKLPYKWMAIESINDGLFSHKSDVWSFGVTCWEVYSGGKNPYPGVGPHELISMLDREGRRMDKPENTACPEQMYRVMLNCWNCEPQDRPTFSQLVTTVTALVNEIAGYLELSEVTPLPSDNETNSSEPQHDHPPPLPPDRRRQKTMPVKRNRRHDAFTKHSVTITNLSIRRRYKPYLSEVPEITIDGPDKENDQNTSIATTKSL